MARELTERQKRIMEFLKSFIREHGYPPTVREMGEHFGFTWPAARGHLRALQRKGVIRMQPLKSRGIEILDSRLKDLLELPLAGSIRAGRPVLAVEEIEGRILVDRGLFKAEDAFALRVTGDSMAEAGILDGDYAVVRPQRKVNSGETAVVLVGEEATVKQVSIQKDSVTLIPANSTMKPVTYRPDEVSIVGKVIGVIRKL